ALNFNGIDTVLYSVCDSGVPLPVICFTDTLFIAVTAVNDQPVALDSSGNPLETIYRTTKVNTPINICIDALDVERDTLDVISSFNGPTNGSTSGLANGDTCFTYAPNAGFIGNDSLFITLCDTGGCDTVLVYIKVTPLTPKAKNYSVKVNNGKIKVLILENDSNPGGGKLTVSIVTLPAGGPTTFDSTGITYTPSIDFCGMDSLQYKVCNEQGLCDSAWIYFTVIPIDSDKDGIPDYVETKTADSDEDGVLDYLSLDSDGDGILDRIEALGNLDDPCNVVLADCDSDGTPDYKDPKNCNLGIRVPKGFSPNGDGANDLFIIPGLDEYPNNSITIFNRWGNKIFEAAPYENNWGGKSENRATVGEGALPEGTYFFVLELSPDEKPIKSYIYLKR
ncbi:gliding motility-associated C-terminal domain-containing protein, partial [Salibacteraceae bacterium]|nr:gliding motility-associated C-terminal domain-containing protein [Salibacteraceae bacterium]